MEIVVGNLINTAIQAIITGASTAVGGGLGAWFVARHLIARIDGENRKNNRREGKQE